MLTLPMKPRRRMHQHRNKPHIHDSKTWAPNNQSLAARVVDVDAGASGGADVILKSTPRG
eukprot:9059337-Lingulodinium_polyedra.AAC.1